MLHKESGRDHYHLNSHPCKQKLVSHQSVHVCDTRESISIKVGFEKHHHVDHPSVLLLLAAVVVQINGGGGNKHVRAVYINYMCGL